MRRPRIIYYAFGGGLGHVARSLSLTRQLAAVTSADHWLLFNTPFHQVLAVELRRQSFLQVRRMDADASPAAAQRFVSAQLSDIQPDVLIVDTFPRGLGGELAELLPTAACRLCVLVARHLPRDYVESYRLLPLVRRHFNLVLTPGETTPFDELQTCVRTSPFLLRGHDELPSVGDACCRLGVESPAVLLVGSGNHQECREAAELFSRLQRSWNDEWPPLRFVHPSAQHQPQPQRLNGPLFPLLDVFPAVRLLIGAAGYNLVHEAGALGIPVIVKPQGRMYDNQFLRAHQLPQFDSAESLMTKIDDALFHSRSSPARLYSNGAEQAAELIARQLGLHAKLK